MVGEPFILSSILTSSAVLFQKAQSILNTLPDIPNPVNIGTQYRPRRPAWLTLLLDIKQTALHAISHVFASISILPDISLEKLKNPHESTSLHIGEFYKKSAQTAFALLAESASHLNPDALYALGDLNFYGNYTHTQDFAQSLDNYKTLASLTGNSTAQFMVGLMYSTGMFGTTPANQAKANLYYTFAANAGDLRAQMAMGFRHLNGIGTPKSSISAVKYYKETADKSFKYFFEGKTPGGRVLARPSWILPNDDGGVYGEGASYASSGDNAGSGFPSGVRTVEEAIEYFHYLAEENNAVYAHFVLAMLYYEGGKTLDPDFEMSVEYAKRGAAYLWKPDGTSNVAANKLGRFAIQQGSHCAGFIGARYLGGQGVEQDFAKAKMWFLRGIEHGDYISLNSLGFMYYHGIGVEKDLNKGVGYIKKAAESKYGPAHFNLGYAYAQRNHPGDAMKAYEQFDLASKKRSIPAWYYKGLMLYNGFHGKEKPVERSIDGAVVHFKIVSEVMEELHSPLKWAHDKFAQKDYGSAMLGFMISAEMGHETAQMNLAYLLDEQRGLLDLGSIKGNTFNFIKSILTFGNKTMEPESKSAIRNMAREKTALVYWTRAGRQLNYDAIVKMGDYYFSGIGTDKPDPAKAAACYQSAADHTSSLANWNLGWMHENGIGAEQSFHLAKRYYDLAAADTREAFFPVQLSLLKLRVRSFWSSVVSDGTLNRIASLTSYDDESSDENKSSKSFREGLRQMWRYWRDTSPPHADKSQQSTAKSTEDEEIADLQTKTIWDDGESGTSSSSSSESTGGTANADNFEDSLDSLLVFAIIALFGAFMWYRQRQQVRFQNQLRARAEEQRRRLQRGNEDNNNDNNGEQPQNPEQQANNNRFMFQAGDGWVGFQFRAGF